LATRIQIRRDTLANWTSNNPILANGEISFVTDLNRIKVGDGTQNWLSLSYLEADAYIGSVIMGEDTEGLYVESISAGNGISVSGSGVETASVTITNEGVLALTGTTNEIDVSSSTGSVTLSLPETINANTTGNAATATKLATARTIELAGDVSGSASFDGSGSVSISATIQPDSVALGADTTGNYVATIAGTTNQVTVSGSGSETAAVTLSLPSTINVDTSGNAATATKLATARTIELAGDVSGSASFDGSGSVSISATIQPDSVALGTDTTGNYVQSVTGSGDGISVSGTGEGASVTVANTGVTSLAGTADQVTVSASTGAVTIGLPNTVTIQSDLNVLGDFTVSGSATIINTQTLIVEDKNIEIGKVENPTDTTANGGGITLKGATDKTFNWIDATDSWTSSEHIDLASGKVFKVNGTEILSPTEYTGNAATATKLATARTIELAGDVSGSASFDGSGSVSISATIQPDSVALGTDTTGNYVQSVTGSGDGISVSGTGEGASVTVANTGVTSLAGTADQVTVSASTGSVTLSLPSTINVDTSGNAATATKLATTRAITLTGDVTGTANFDGSASAGLSTTLANTAVTPASYGSASAVSTFTVDSKGRLTAASSTAIEIAQSAVTNLTTDLSAKAALNSPTFTGTPAAPTAAARTNTTQLATTAFVYEEVNKVSVDTKTASYTLAVADAGKVIEMNVASANDLTIPLNNSVAIPIGSTIDIIQYGEGQTTIVATGGVTIRSKEGNLKLTGQYSGATLYKRGTDEWVVVGDLTS
jgi:hypothetical protein